MKIELYTRSGEFLAAAQIPEFAIPPDIVLWGERIFHSDFLLVETSDDDSFAYSESCVYIIPEGAK